MAAEIFHFNLWHQHLGHLIGQQLKEASRKNLLNKRFRTIIIWTSVRATEKASWRESPFKSAGKVQLSGKLQLVHTDVCGPMQTEQLIEETYRRIFTLLKHFLPT